MDKNSPLLVFHASETPESLSSEFNNQYRSLLQIYALNAAEIRELERTCSMMWDVRALHQQDPHIGCHGEAGKTVQVPLGG